MPAMQGSVSVAANSTSTNQVAGLLYEYLPQNAAVTLSCTGSATGLTCSFLAGGVALVDDMAIGLQNRFPVIPDDILTQEMIPAGAKLILRFRNTTAGALTAFWRLDLNF